MDNGSDAINRRWLTVLQEQFVAEFASLQVIYEGNIGYGLGCKVGIAASSSDLVLVTNVDVVYEPDALVNAIGVATADAADVACWELRQRPFEHPKYYDPVTLLTNWCSHAAVIIRRSAYEQVGGHDKHIFMYGEDVELSYRLRSFGWKLRYLPHSVVTHDVSLVDADVVRPRQLAGSLAASVLLRERYWGRVAASEMLKQVERLGTVQIDPGRREAFKQAAEMVRRDRDAFKKIRNSAGAHFPFRGFDYEMMRDGHDVPDAMLPHGTSGPKVTIITRTTGRRPQLLEQALVSVANQTYRSIEHLIVEDGSEYARDAVEAFATSYGRDIRYFSIPRAGRSAAGNAGFRMAEGKYVMLLDDDDLLFADHVELLAGTLEREIGYSAAYSLAWAVDTKFGDDGRYSEYSFWTPDGHRQHFDRTRFHEANFIPIQSILLDRSLVLAFGGFHEDMDTLEDWNLWVRFAEASKFKLVPRTTSLYRVPYEQKAREERDRMFQAAYHPTLERNRTDIERMGLQAFEMKASEQVRAASTKVERIANDREGAADATTLE